MTCRAECIHAKNIYLTNLYINICKFYRKQRHVIQAAGELEINLINRDRRYEEHSNIYLKQGGVASEADGNEVEQFDVLTTLINIYHRHLI